MLTLNGSETEGRIARALAPRNVPAAHFNLDSESAADLRRMLERDGRSGTTRQVRLDGRTAFVYIGFRRGGEPYVHGVGESPELAIAEAFLNSMVLERR